MQRITYLLDSLKSLYTDALGENLVGLYVHGSLAFGCFEWARSDVDFIAVVRRPRRPKPSCACWTRSLRCCRIPRRRGWR